MLRQSKLFIPFLLLVLAVPCLAQETDPVPEGFLTGVETAVCASVEDRQPVGEAASFTVDIGQVFFWTKCIGAADSTFVQHVWIKEGETIATVELPVKSSMWRTWSSKKLLPSWTGNWEVRILDAGGNILQAVNFTIEPPAVKVEPQPVEEPGVDSSKS